MGSGGMPFMGPVFYCILYIRVAGAFGGEARGRRMTLSRIDV